MNPKRICICGSMVFIDEMEVLTDEQAFKLKQSDLVLIANYPKNGIEGYVGANSLMEAAFAYPKEAVAVLVDPL